MQQVLDVAQATDIGRRRERNEDALLCDAGRRLFVVADGMGGHPAGDVAARVAVDRIDAELTARRLTAGGAEDPEALRASLDAAHRAVLDDAAAHPERRGMGTTAVVAHLSSDARLLLAHVGDSRAYVAAGGRLRRVTDDHTSPAPFGRTLTQALGSPRGIRPDTSTVPLDDGARVLLCTDGLTDMVSDEGIARVLAAAGDASTACRYLVREALDQGGHDNVTVIIVDVAAD